MGPPVLEPPSPDLVVIQVDALSAALAKLQVTGITAAQLIDTIKREERKPPPASSNPERKKALLQLATKPPKDNFGSLPPYKSTFTKGPAGTSDKSAKARRLKLRDLARSEFPDGKIPDPYAAAWLNQYGAALKDLPFICATICISPHTWPEGTSEPMQTFEDAWVLWDTGAQVSQILSSQLHEDIKKNEEGTVDQSGFAVAKVRFAGVQLEIESNIAFRPHMPNNTTFIILGQQTLLNSIEYQIQPAVVNPQLRALNNNAYGQIERRKRSSAQRERVVVLERHGELMRYEF